eukprot:5013546-Pleurochrysis_carterae.AAC.3
MASADTKTELGIKCMWPASPPIDNRFNCPLHQITYLLGSPTCIADQKHARHFVHEGNTDAMSRLLGLPVALPFAADLMISRAAFTSTIASQSHK